MTRVNLVMTPMRDSVNGVVKNPSFLVMGFLAGATN